MAYIYIFIDLFWASVYIFWAHKYTFLPWASLAWERVLLCLRPGCHPSALEYPASGSLIWAFRGVHFTGVQLPRTYFVTGSVGGEPCLGSPPAYGLAQGGAVSTIAPTSNLYPVTYFYTPKLASRFTHLHDPPSHPLHTHTHTRSSVSFLLSDLTIT